MHSGKEKCLYPVLKARSKVVCKRVMGMGGVFHNRTIIRQWVDES